MIKHFGPIRQIGYVVRDIEAAMRYWSVVLGVGPFFYFDRTPMMDFKYRGEPCAAHISAALAQSGALQIELLQPRDDIETPYLAFLKAGHEGAQHMCFWTENFDADLSQATETGLDPVLSGYTVEPEGRFVYFSDKAAPHPGGMIELSSLSPGKKTAFESIASASLGWDGSKSVRHMD